MPDIRHDFPIFAPPTQVYAAITTPTGLDAWWSLTSKGEPTIGSTYHFDFGPGYQWQAVVRGAEPDAVIEWEFTTADDDWRGSRLALRLEPIGGGTHVRFDHTGWPEANDHYRTSSFCWAMYLRLLKKYVETGAVVAYAERLDA